MKSKHNKKNEKRGFGFGDATTTIIVLGLASLVIIGIGMYFSVMGYFIYAALSYIIGLLVFLLAELDCACSLLRLIAELELERGAILK